MIDRPELRLAARRTGYPRLRVTRHLTLAGADAWHDAIDRTTPPERAELLRRLGPRLLSVTATARANRRRWVRAGKPGPPPEAGASIVVGDVEAAALFATAVDLVPRPVAWHALEYLRVFGSGFSTRAWSGFAPPWRPLVTQLSGSADLHSACHEIAHLWNQFDPDTAPAEIPTAAQWAAAHALVGRYPDLASAAAEHELLADCLAHAWMLAAEPSAS